MSRRFFYKQKDDFEFITSIGNQTEDLYLSCFGRKANEPEYRYGPAIRSYDLIHVILRGKGTLLLNNAEYHISEGQAFFIPCGLTADYYADFYEPWEYLWIGYNGTSAALFNEQTGFSLDTPVCQLDVATEQFETMMNEILPYTTISISDELYRIGWLYRILSLFTGASRLPSTKSADVTGKLSKEQILEQAVAYIDQHSHTATVTALAEYLQINRSHLFKIFETYYGISPQNFIMNKRFERALALLDTTDLPIKQIAEETGFGDTSGFSKQFKKRMGVSPRIYRKRTEGGTVFNGK